MRKLVFAAIHSLMKIRNGGTATLFVAPGVGTENA